MTDRKVLKRVTAKLAVHYTEAQRTAMHQERLDLVDDRLAHDQWWSEQKDAEKAKRKRLEERDFELHRKLRAGSEHKDVLTLICIAEDDPTMVEIIREDTGEVIKRRPATAWEQQIIVPGTEGEPDGVEEVDPSDAPAPASPTPKSRQLAHDPDVIDAEFTETPAAFTEGAKAFADLLAGAPAEECGNPYPEGDKRFDDWSAGYMKASYDHDFAKGYESHKADKPMPAMVSDAFLAGWDAYSKPDPTDQVIEALKTMTRELRVAYFDDIENRDLLFAIHKKLVGSPVTSRTRSATLVNQIINRLEELDSQ